MLVCGLIGGFQFGGGVGGNFVSGLPPPPPNAASNCSVNASNFAASAAIVSSPLGPVGFPPPPPSGGLTTGATGLSRSVNACGPPFIPATWLVPNNIFLSTGTISKPAVFNILKKSAFCPFLYQSNGNSLMSPLPPESPRIVSCHLTIPSLGSIKFCIPFGASIFLTCAIAADLASSALNLSYCALASSASAIVSSLVIRSLKFISIFLLFFSH